MFIRLVCWNLFVWWWSRAYKRGLRPQVICTAPTSGHFSLMTWAIALWCEPKLSANTAAMSFSDTSTQAQVSPICNPIPVSCSKWNSKLFTYHSGEKVLKFMMKTTNQSYQIVQHFADVGQPNSLETILSENVLERVTSWELPRALQARWISWVNFTVILDSTPSIERCGIRRAQHLGVFHCAVTIRNYCFISCHFFSCTPFKENRIAFYGLRCSSSP